MNFACAAHVILAVGNRHLSHRILLLFLCNFQTYIFSLVRTLTTKEILCMKTFKSVTDVEAAGLSPPL